MAMVMTSVRIRCTPQAAFDAFTDLERAAERIPAIKAIEILQAGKGGAGAAAGTMGQGTRWRETRVMFGKEATEEMEITAFEPPRAYTAEARSHGMHYITRFTFRPVAAGETEVEVQFEYRPEKFSSKVTGAVMGPLMKHMVRKCFKADMEALKAVLERQAGGTGGEAGGTPAGRPAGGEVAQAV
jgi:ribosome-associated toxin RatA of RatAB toxin-antitoxin module